MPKLLLISDQDTIIERWQQLLALDYTIEVIHQLNLKSCHEYTLIILDSYFIDAKLFDIAAIKQYSAKFLIIGQQWPEERQVSVLVAGAAGYCDCLAATSVILKAVESILQGDIWMQRHLITKVIGSLVKLTTAQPVPAPVAHLNSAKLASLSARELEVARLIGQGVCNKDIAATLFISERTVKAHLTSIFSKLDIPNRLHLGILFKDAGE